VVIVKATRASQAGKLPSQELMAAMGNYNEELAQAGILLEIDGLRPSPTKPLPESHPERLWVRDGLRADRLAESVSRGQERAFPVPFSGDAWVVVPGARQRKPRETLREGSPGRCPGVL
jgi:hypothetical protein